MPKSFNNNNNDPSGRSPVILLRVRRPVPFRRRPRHRPAHEDSTAVGPASRATGYPPAPGADLLIVAGDIATPTRTARACAAERCGFRPCALQPAARYYAGGVRASGWRYGGLDFGAPMPGCRPPTNARGLIWLERQQRAHRWRALHRHTPERPTLLPERAPRPHITRPAHKPPQNLSRRRLLPAQTGTARGGTPFLSKRA